MNWIKPATPPHTPYSEGFAFITNAQASPYLNQTLAADLGNAASNLLTIGQSNWPALLNYDVHAIGNTLTVLNAGAAPGKLAASFNAKTGLLTLTFRPPGASANVTAKGVVLQNSNTVLGWFMETNQGGFFILK